MEEEKAKRRSRADKSVWVSVGEYSALAFVLPTTTFVGYIAGYYLDRYFGTNFLYLVFLLLGIAAGFIQLFRQLKKDSHQSGS